MHLFIELITLAFFLVAVAHAVALRGREGAWLLGTLLVLGAVRENFVILQSYLYGFAPLTLMLGKAPVIAAIIWGYSIYIAVLWAEEMTGEVLARHRLSARFLAAVALFMVCLAAFYEPFLELIGMARWQPGTRATLQVPWITFLGYPTLAGAFLWLWCRVMRGTTATGRRLAAFALGLPLLAFAHAFGLQWVKDQLGW